MEGLEQGEAKLLAERYGLDYGNKLKHVFENNLHEHNLGSLVSEFGSQGNAFISLQRAADALKLGNGAIPVGTFVTVGEYSTVVTISGRVIDGIVKISSAFR